MVHCSHMFSFTKTAKNGYWENRKGGVWEWIRLEWLTHSTAFSGLPVSWGSVPCCPAGASFSHSKQIPSLLWLAPFPLLLERAQGHWFFHTHSLSSICLIQLPGLRAELLWCSVLVTVSSPLSASTALCLGSTLASLRFWCGNSEGILR